MAETSAKLLTIDFIFVQFLKIWWYNYGLIILLKVFKKTASLLIYQTG